MPLTSRRAAAAALALVSVIGVSLAIGRGNRSPVSGATSDSTAGISEDAGVANIEKPTHGAGDPPPRSEATAGNETIAPAKTASGDRAHRVPADVQNPGASGGMDHGSEPLSGPLPSSMRMGRENAEAPALTWDAPPPWQAVPNPNAMRVASYRAAPAGHGEEALDLSVARAGGTAEANVQRWLGQFDDANRTQRRESRQVHGLDVQLVEIAGTYLGGAMMPGAATTPRSNWTLLAAIVATPAGAPYFFKLVGPSSAVENVRPSFDRLIGSVAPR